MAKGVSKTRRRLLASLPLALVVAEPAIAAKLFSRQVRQAKARAPVSSDIEKAALVHLRKQNFEQAMAVLEAGVEHDLSRGAPSLRLFDLLATLYARRGRAEKLAALSDKVLASPCTPVMLERAAKWRDESSKWRRDRANRESTIKWRWTTHIKNGSRKYTRRDDIIIPA